VRTLRRGLAYFGKDVVHLPSRARLLIRLNALRIQPLGHYIHKGHDADESHAQDAHGDGNLEECHTSSAANEKMLRMIKVGSVNQFEFGMMIANMSKRCGPVAPCHWMVMTTGSNTNPDVTL